MISFLGGYRAGEYVYTHGCATGKRVQANLGVMNHAAVLSTQTDYQCLRWSFLQRLHASFAWLSAQWS